MSSFKGPEVENIEAANDGILEGWRKFFKVAKDHSDEKKSLYAMGKLVQVAMVNYMKLRGVFPEDCFAKNRYQGYKFYTLNTQNQESVDLNKIIRSVGRFINASSIKSFKLQLLHNPQKPKEIGEEICFMFYFGKKKLIELDFGQDDKLELNMSDSTFETFLNCFGMIMGKINNYCVHLEPLPVCEQRFRVSFYKKPPKDFERGPFDKVAGKLEYAPEMYAKDVGASVLPRAATASILRTCYSSHEIDNVINDSTELMVQSEINVIMGQSEEDLFLDVPRSAQRLDEVSYQGTLDGKSIHAESIVVSPRPSVIPIEDISNDSVQEIISLPSEEQEVMIVEAPSKFNQAYSPAYSTPSLVSREVILSPFIDRSAVVVETALYLLDEFKSQIPNVEEEMEPENKRKVVANKSKKTKKTPNLKYSSEEDSPKHRRKVSSAKRKKTSKNVIPEASKPSRRSTRLQNR